MSSDHCGGGSERGMEIEIFWPDYDKMDPDVPHQRTIENVRSFTKSSNCGDTVLSITYTDGSTSNFSGIELHVINAVCTTDSDREGSL